MRALILLSFLCGCGSGPPPPATADYKCSGPVLFKSVQVQIFDGCGPNCHQMSPPAGGLDLSSKQAWADLVHAASKSSPSKFLVEPGDPAHSFLWQKLTDQLDANRNEGSPMPRDGSDRWAPLSPDQLTTVNCWITSGAKND